MPQFYAVMLEWIEQPQGYVRVFWASAAHLSEAIDKAQSCALRHGIINAFPSQADPYNFDTLPQTATTDDNGETYISDTAFSFPPEPAYRLPCGVIASASDGEYDVLDINPGYQIVSKEQGGLHPFHRTNTEGCFSLAL